MTARPSSSAPSRRLFVAAWPDPVIRSALAAARANWLGTDEAAHRPVPIANLHLTLHFLGDVDERCIVAARLGLAVAFEPFVLSFGTQALWPNGIAVIEPFDRPDALLALHLRLADALRRLSLPVEERPYRPHVTLARRVAEAKTPATSARIDWRVERYALVESRRGRRGYDVLGTYP